MYNESGRFVPEFIRTEADAESYIREFFPQSELSDLRTAVLKQYPADGSPYRGNARKRTEAVIRDLSFTCNTRVLYDAYHNNAKTYMMQYNVGSAEGLAFHAADLIPLFWNGEFDFLSILKKLLPKVPEIVLRGLLIIVRFEAPRYQSYFTSHAINGDPNSNSKPHWKPAQNDSNYVKQVMEVTGNLLGFFNPKFTDVINTNKACDFWKQAASNITDRFPGSSYSLETPESQAVLHEILK